MTQPVQAKYPPLDAVFHAISNWVNDIRERTNQLRELGQCSPDEISAIARDLKITTADLRAISRKGAGSAENLQKMLAALHIDRKTVDQGSPAVLRDLQRLCVTCGNKQRCEHEFDAGTAAEHFHEFCPNSYTLDALLQQNAEPEAKAKTDW
jgi:hypothetical protein